MRDFDVLFQSDFTSFQSMLQSLKTDTVTPSGDRQYNRVAPPSTCTLGGVCQDR